MKALARGCVLLILLLVASPAAVYNQTWLENTFGVDVGVTTTWTDTGIQVAAGDSLFIRAQGSVSDGAASWDGWFGPEGLIRGPSGGCVDCPLAGYPQGALIGRIDTGSPFYVGPFISFSCTSSGVLYLGVNDNSPGSYVGTMRAFVWGGAAVPPPPVIDCTLGSCTSYTFLASVRGDIGSDNVTYMANGARWLRILIAEDNGSMSCVALTATITLTPPPGANYDLYVYCDGCFSVAGSSTQAGSAVEVVNIGWQEECNLGFPTGSDSGRYVYIKVACTSVSIEDNWTLSVLGNTGASCCQCSTM